MAGNITRIAGLALQQSALSVAAFCDSISSSPLINDSVLEGEESGIDTGVEADEADVIEQSQGVVDAEEEYPHDLL